ncbi:hypothetical protein IH980_04025 [Patescibacteria group bacterium]|nr:hypothetical protein [Patescibacteria group bacterium]
MRKENNEVKDNGRGGEDMEHYICTGGCGGVSGKPGACQTSGCAKHQQPLTACDCSGPEHAEAAKSTEVKEEATGE